MIAVSRGVGAGCEPRSGRRVRLRATIAPGHVVADDGDHRGGAAPRLTARTRSATSGKPATRGPCEQDQDDRAAQVGAGELVDAAVGHRAPWPAKTTGASASVSRASAAGEDDLAGARSRPRGRWRSSAAWLLPGVRSTRRTGWNQLPFSPAGSSPRARNCAAI